MVFKQIIIAILAVIVVSVSADSYIVGRRIVGDGLVCFGDINIRAQPGKIVKAGRYCNLPKWNQKITQIEAIDVGLPGRGGYAEIVKGGLNQTNVTLYLWSQTSQPLNFTISVFAKPPY